MCTFRDKFGIVSLIKLLYILSNTVGLVEGIRGGTDVNDGEFTYQVVILINNMHACGGAILTSRHIASGAQCVLDSGGNFINAAFRVIFGITSNSGWVLRDRFKVQLIYVLFDFRPPNRTYYLFPQGLENGDLSILKLEKQIPLGRTSGLKSVDLPTVFYHNNHKFTYLLANISGFGQNNPTTYQSASDLNNLGYRRNLHGEMKYVQQRVERKDYCRNKFEQFNENVWDNHICANSVYTNSSGACIGDIGGPLVIGSTLIGVLQIYNTNCDDRVTPGIYTRVTEYIDFIDDVLRNRFESNMRLANYTGLSVNEIIHESRRG